MQFYKTKSEVLIRIVVKSEFIYSHLDDALKETLNKINALISAEV